MTVSPEYLAGFLDGEGTIQISRTGNNKVGDVYTSYTCRVSLANCHLGVLEAIKRDHGGSIFRITRGSVRNRIGYRVQWFGPAAFEIIRLIYPHLIIKRAQADLAFEFEAACNAVKREWRGHRGRTRTLEEASALNHLRLRLKVMNQRGVQAPGAEMQDGTALYLQ